jgi:SAM-dependent methyltransferase
VINLILSSLFNLRDHRGAPRSVFVLIDDASKISAPDYLRCLRPWASWVRVLGAVQGDASSLLHLIASPALDAAEIVVIVTRDAALCAALKAICESRGKTCVDSDIPAEGGREMALFQEVLHHDFELGGFNEWTGGDSQFSAPVLRLLSAAHCRGTYPVYAEPYLAALRAASHGGPLKALDVGCGPISRLRWGSLNDELSVTGVDPLLDMYAVVRERHGLSALREIRCAAEVCAGAEGLSTLTPDAFDFAYCSNALDHTENPVAVVNTIAQVLRPGGILAIQVYTREGSREKWWQLHQFDMYVNDTDQFVCETRDGVVREIFPDGCGFVVRQFVVRNDEHTRLVAERVAA